MPAIALAVVAAVTKFGSARYAGRPLVLGPLGWRRAGASFVARRELSIVIASVGASVADAEELASLAVTFVLITAVAAPLLAKRYDSPRS